MSFLVLSEPEITKVFSGETRIINSEKNNIRQSETPRSGLGKQKFSGATQRNFIIM